MSEDGCFGAVVIIAIVAAFALILLASCHDDSRVQGMNEARCQDRGGVLTDKGCFPPASRINYGEVKR